jgi:hypothetical protein
MTRELIIAGICIVATIAVGWLVDHPDKVAGTILLFVLFLILVGIVRLRGS